MAPKSDGWRQTASWKGPGLQCDRALPSGRWGRRPHGEPAGGEPSSAPDFSSLTSEASGPQALPHWVRTTDITRGPVLNHFTKELWPQEEWELWPQGGRGSGLHLLHLPGHGVLPTYPAGCPDALCEEHTRTRKTLVSRLVPWRRCAGRKKLAL